MVCNHLSELYQLCEKHQLRIAGADLVRLVCNQCNHEETCPSALMAEETVVALSSQSASGSTQTQTLGASSAKSATAN